MHLNESEIEAIKSTIHTTFIQATEHLLNPDNF